MGKCDEGLVVTLQSGKNLKFTSKKFSALCQIVDHHVELRHLGHQADGVRYDGIKLCELELLQSGMQRLHIYALHFPHVCASTAQSSRHFFTHTIQDVKQGPSTNALS